MPDISNEDLMKLIYRVIKKVDIIEEKLDRLLQEKDKTANFRVVDDSEEVDYNFKFSPIKNDEELDHVSELIEHNERYKRNLVSESPLIR